VVSEEFADCFFIARRARSFGEFLEELDKTVLRRRLRGGAAREGIKANKKRGEA
jgi:hypothetical protein